MQRYHRITAIAAVLLFFSGAELYFFAGQYSSATPRDWVTALAALVSPLLVWRLSRGHLIDKRLGLLAIWGTLYVMVSLVWFSFAPSDGAMQELRDRGFAVVFMLLAGFVFIDPDSRQAAGRAAILVVLATVAINLAQMIEPDWFWMTVTSRSSGLYGNANRCGAALTIGMIMGSQAVPSRLRLAYYLLVGVGVVVTFSRSTIVGWLIIAGLMLIVVDSSKARTREFAGAAVVTAVLLLLLLPAAAALGFNQQFTLDDNQYDRVAFFRTFEASDNAAQERREVAAQAWGMFLDEPLRGNGLGSTVLWNERESTHNMYLSLMADHGLVGALILPALIVCVLLGRPNTSPGSHWAFCLFTLWYALFSHNILTERYQLMAFAFFAMGGASSREALRRPLSFRSGDVGLPASGALVQGAQAR